MSIAAPEPKANMGQPIPRYDAVAKVTGKAQYGADVALVDPVYAFLVTSSIAKGRIDGFDLSAAKQVRGVVDIVTHENAEKLKEAKLFSNGGYTSSTIQPLKSADIAQEGQIVAVVLAETFEAARQAAYAVKVNYTAAIPTTTFDSPGTTSAPAKGQLSQFKEIPRSAISPRHSTPPRSKSPQSMRRRRSTITRWSCSPPVAPGTATT
jgi:xanthine dehydrogenase YagR molybdenum-binding subunit